MKTERIVIKTVVLLSVRANATPTTTTAAVATKDTQSKSEAVQNGDENPTHISSKALYSNAAVGIANFKIIFSFDGIPLQYHTSTDWQDKFRLNNESNINGFV